MQAMDKGLTLKQNYLLCACPILCTEKHSSNRTPHTTYEGETLWYT